MDEGEAMTSESKEAYEAANQVVCQHRMKTYKSLIVGGYRKRYRVCKCGYHDTLLVPMEFSYLKSDRITNVGIKSVDSSAIAPTLE